MYWPLNKDTVSEKNYIWAVCNRAYFFLVVCCFFLFVVLIVILLRTFVRTALILLGQSPTIACTRCSEHIKTLGEGKQFY